jgi:large subunit ribosomal protein L30
MSAQKKIAVTLIKSKYGRKKGHLECVRGLGLRKINHRVELDDTSSIRGMINKVSYLLSVEEI